MANSNRDSKLIFITGAHAVGKSTICKKISPSIGFEYFKASDLIRSYYSRDLPSNKQIANRDELYLNQYALVEEVSHLRYVGQNNILLEGHTCLINQNMQIEQIPMEVFWALNISAIVIVARQIDEISKSILLRDHISYSLDIIQHLQDQEVATANLISEELAIPLLCIDSSNEGNSGFKTTSRNARQLEKFLISV